MSRKNKNRIPASKHLVDIIIPVYGRFDLLERCLNAIPGAMQDIPYKVSIFDNGSPGDEKRAFYDSYKPSYPLKIYENPTNLGFPAACNFLASHTSAPLIFLLTSDVFLNKGTGVALVKEMDDPSIGVVGLKLLFPPDTPSGPAGKVQHVGLGVNIRGEIFHLFIGWSPDHPKVLKVRDVFAVTGAAFMTRRLIWNKTRGFHPDYGLGTYEDADFCMQVRKKLGYNIIVSQEAIGYHWTNASALAYNVSFPINDNRRIFLARFGKELEWDEYKYW